MGGWVGGTHSSTNAAFTIATRPVGTSHMRDRHSCAVATSPATTLRAMLTPDHKGKGPPYIAPQRDALRLVATTIHHAYSIACSNAMRHDASHRATPHHTAPRRFHANHIATPCQLCILQRVATRHITHAAPRRYIAQHNTTQHNTLQHNTPHADAAMRRALYHAPHNTRRRASSHFSTPRRAAPRHDTTRHNATHHTTSQTRQDAPRRAPTHRRRNAARHITTRHNAIHHVNTHHIPPQPDTP